MSNSTIIKANVGDSIEVVLNNGHTESGIMMPSSKEGIILIKLSTGYNVGFEKSEIKSVKVISKAKESNQSKGEIKQNKNLPKISILHTGGTIASSIDYRTGGVVSSFTPEDLVTLFPELLDTVQFDSELIAQMWSDDLRYIHFLKIARAIEKKIKKGATGIIVGMGTDNLAVAAAAVSFILEKCPVPVVFVGSQRSSDRGSSDAAMNLICAAKFIVESDFAGVAICMHGSSEDDYCNILPGTKTYKLHSSRRDAFTAINDSAIAKVWYKKDEANNNNNNCVEFLKENYLKRDSNETCAIKDNMEDKVGLIKVHTNMFAAEFKAFRGFKGLIVEGTGLGHLPIHTPTKGCEEHQKIKEEIEKLISEGCVIVMTTSCLFGSVNMNVYDKGRDLLEMGIISGEDMLSTTAQVKLAWLLANYPEISEVKRLMQTNLRGEIVDRLKYDKNFI